MKSILWLCFLLLMLSSCNSKSDKLNTNEQQLAKQILAEEQEGLIKRNSIEPEQAGLDTFPIGIRYQPERSVDPANPPEIIDIAGNIDKVREFELSDFCNTVQYLRLEQTPDSTFWGQVNNDIHSSRRKAPLKEEISLQIIKNSDYIVAYNHLGILLYNSKGHLLKTICSNDFTGFGLYKSGVSVRSGSTFKGAHLYPRLVGDKLYYSYEDDVNKIAKMMELDCENLPLALPSDLESQNEIIGLGKPVANTGENSYSAIALSPTTYSKIGHPSRDEAMFTIYNSNGDTLCSFPGNQKIENYTKSVGRTPDWGNRIFYKNSFFFREAHSDTIFKVVPPNKLIPAFIINLGEFKIHNVQDGMDPAFDLSNKFIPKAISITDDYVFIYYTKGYNSPHNRKKKAVKYFHAVYNRKTKELWHVKSDPYDYEYFLENNVDGGLPVWPGKYNFEYFSPCTISGNGEMVQSIKGIELKRFVQSDEFKNTNAPEDKKKEFLRFVNSIGDYETIVIEMQ